LADPPRRRERLFRLATRRFDSDERAKLEWCTLPVVGAACEIKGVAFHTFFQALRELRGEAAVEATRAELAPELREQLRLGAIARVGYYPLTTYAELHAAAHRALHGGEALAREIGRKTAEIDTRGVLRFVLGFTSTDLLVRHADKVWASFARGARVRAEKLHERRYSVGFEGFWDASELVLVELEGALATLVERTGANDPLVRHTRDREDSTVRYIVEWS
jgi:hypothetical protein